MEGFLPLATVMVICGPHNSFVKVRALATFLIADSKALTTLVNVGWRPSAVRDVKAWVTNCSACSFTLSTSLLRP